ncbi:MAG: hypothetical protein N2316_03465 [Spirochaetes bacterium]|nr:hypothetical protein [Spirochaetota bacterium]
MKTFVQQFIFFIAFLSVIAFLSGCCFRDIRYYYEYIPGTAKITAIEISQYNPDGTKSYRDVFFDFIPHDPLAPQRYRYKNISDSHQRLFVNSYGNLHISWVTKKNVKIGNNYAAIRMEKKNGCGGAPVVFDVQVE